MQKLSISLASLLCASAVACSFKVGSSSDPATPQNPPATPAATPAPATPTPRPVITRLGRGKSSTTPGGTTPTTPTPTVPPGVPVLVGTNVFGQGTPDPAGYKGSYYVIPPATQKLPALETMTATGVLFAKELNVPNKAMTGGFPGIDATRNENFAIRWEAPLVVDNEADYTFRVVSDDGAVVSIDGTLIVDNDGQHTSKEKSGPVHLVTGTHVITVDYFQATGPVQLQLFCKKAGGTETICPTRL